MKNILVVDDEKQIVNVVAAYLEKDGYKVFTAYDGHEALDIFYEEDVDFVILDLMMPKLSGEEVCKKIRLKSDIPIIMLTAKVEEEDRINGLDIGADDYVVKPFSPKELLARIRAIARRTNKEDIKATILEINDGELVIDTNKMEVFKNDELIDLTPTEFKVLSILAQNVGKVFSRDELITKALGFDYIGYDRTIDTHVKNIRHKINDRGNYIKTVYGVGYKFMED
ncbi:response regulator transcription factor [Dethiothermospora halolimnae]|uniref:response regulator transcription factor n=1 Tax=Dethiothermospora halolimnae TaxID=3114390 RepID=UPI003CCC3B1E